MVFSIKIKAYVKQTKKSSNTYGIRNCGFQNVYKEEYGSHSLISQGTVVNV